MDNKDLSEKRAEEREQIFGDIRWSYDAGGTHPFSEGAILDISKSGMSICTHKPLEAGAKVKLYGKGISHDCCTVRWTREISPSLYRSGLLAE